MNAIPLQFGPRGPQFPLTHLPSQMAPAPQQQILREPPVEIFRQPPPPPPQAQQQQPEVEIRQIRLPQFPQGWMRPFQQFQSMINQQRQSPMNNQMPQQPEFQVREIPFHQFLQQQLQRQQPPVPAQMMEAPRPEQQQPPHQPEIRIQLQRVQIPMREISQDISDEQQSQEQERNMPQVQVQQLPLAIALQRAGITTEDLRNIQRMAEERIQEELRQYVNSDSDSTSDEQSSSEESDSQSKSEEAQPQPSLLPIGRSAYGRSLVTPIRIPVPMMQQIQESSADSNESERPHCKNN